MCCRFRWAFCQLDILGRLKTVPDIRKALTELPKTLDETYERILSKIPNKNRKHVHKALQFLAFGNDSDIFDLNLVQLAEAVVVDVEQLSFNPDDRFLQPKDLLEMCTCLVSYDDTTSEIVLAHYSVREYLESERVKPGSFHIEEYAANVLLAKSNIIYMLSVDYRFWDHCPLLYNAFNTWVYYVEQVEKIGGDSIVSDLVLQLLNPRGEHFTHWLAHHNHKIVAEEPLPTWEFAPGAEATATLAYLCIFRFEETAKVLLQRNPGKCILEGHLRRIDSDPDTLNVEGTPLQVAVLCRNPQFVRLLAANGADVDIPINNTSSLLIFALQHLECPNHGLLDTTTQLLDAGANPNPKEVAWTVLQVAAKYMEFWGPRGPWGLELFKILLEAGVDVNGVGSDEAVIAEICKEGGREDDPDAGNENPTVSVQGKIQERGRLLNYDTPLRIIEAWKNCRATGENRVDKKRNFDTIVDLLKSYGAKSLHLFPVKGLPGYVEEDMEEFARISAQEDS
jgi:hypothetical protein